MLGLLIISIFLMVILFAIADTGTFAILISFWILYELSKRNNKK
jgi:hypothetical protein